MLRVVWSWLHNKWTFCHVLQAPACLWQVGVSPSRDFGHIFDSLTTHTRDFGKFADHYDVKLSMDRPSLILIYRSSTFGMRYILSSVYYSYSTLLSILIWYMSMIYVYLLWKVKKPIIHFHSLKKILKGCVVVHWHFEFAFWNVKNFKCKIFW